METQSQQAVFLGPIHHTAFSPRFDDRPEDAGGWSKSTVDLERKYLIKQGFDGALLLAKAAVDALRSTEPLPAKFTAYFGVNGNRKAIFALYREIMEENPKTLTPYLNNIIFTKWGPKAPGAPGKPGESGGCIDPGMAAGLTDAYTIHTPGDQLLFKSSIIICDRAWGRAQLPSSKAKNPVCSLNRADTKKMDTFARVILHEIM